MGTPKNKKQSNQDSYRSPTPENRSTPRTNGPQSLYTRNPINFTNNMPFDHYREATVHSDGRSEPLPPKANPKLLCIVLKAVIMTVVTSIFFLFLGVAAILLLNLCLAGGTLRRRFRTHQHHPSNGLSPQDVKTLSQFQFRESDQDKECVVCLDRINQGQWCRELVGCRHLFHRRCVDMWLVKVAACPICRSRVVLNSVSDHLCSYGQSATTLS